MTAITESFAALRQRHERALIPYFMAGYPTLSRSIDWFRGSASAGADIVEIGVPFSDPVADGPSIQYAGQVALEQGFRLRTLLEHLAVEPLPCSAVMMSYLNPLLAYGRDALLDELIRSRIAGLLVPDLPVDEADDWRHAAARRGIGMIFLVAQTSTDDRIRLAAEATNGFLYAVARIGTTGTHDRLDARMPGFLRRVRAITDKPVAVGFGISSPQQAAELRDHADGVIIGSCLIDAHRNDRSPLELIGAFKQAIRS